jgi:hypothetical protein
MPQTPRQAFGKVPNNSYDEHANLKSSEFLLEFS